MAKKKATKSTEPPYSEDTYNEVSELFDAQISDAPEDKIEQIKKFLSALKDKFEVTAKEVIDVLDEKLGKVKPGAKNRYGTALKRTRGHFDRAGTVSAKPYLGFIIGKQHRINDINSTRLTDLQNEYEGHKETNTQTDVEISKQEYDPMIAEYYKLTNQNEDTAIAYIKSVLDGRFVVYDEDDDTAEDQFIENMETWSSGAKNFNFGKILKASPSRVYTSVILESGVANLVDVNVKGEDRMSILTETDNFKLVTMKVVKNENEGQRWWVDKAFNIEPVENDYEVLEVSDPTKRDKKIIKHMLDAVPNQLQVLGDSVDSWQRKTQKSTGKDNVLALVKGTVHDIFYGDNDRVTITLTNDSDDVEDLDIWGENFSPLRFRVGVTAELAATVDFDVDTVLYVWGEVYRGAFYDSQTRTFDEEKKADMPSMNAWGFVADPDLKNERVESESISAEDLETTAEQDTSGFQIEDD